MLFKIDTLACNYLLQYRIKPYNVSSKYRNTPSYIKNAAVYKIPYKVSLKIQKYTELHLKCSSVQNTI